MKWLFLSIATLATSLIIGQSAAAQSAYEDAILLTDSIGVTTDEGFYDISNSWLTVFDQYKDRTQSGVYIGDLYDEFLDELYSENPQYGLFANYSTPEAISTGYARSTTLFWIRPGCTYTGDTFTETSYSILSSGSGCIQRIAFARDPNNTDDIRLEQYTFGSGLNISLNTPTNQNKIFFSTLEPNYPVDYEGEIIPDVAPGGDPQRTPRATIAVNDKDLTIDFESAGGVNDYIYSWHLSRYVPSDGLDPLTLEDVETGFDRPGDAHSTYLEHRGNYALSIRMCAADHDQETPECASLENTRAAWLDIFADGSYFSISTGGNMDSEDLQNCITDDLGGQSTTRCQAKLMDDCALDGDTMLDKIGQIPGLITCQLRNYFSGVRSLAMFLMIPSSHQLQQTINDFLDNVQAQLGFVYESFGILIGGIGDIITAAGTANCVLPLGTWYGDDLELSLCEVRAMFGETAWNLAMLLIRGGIAFGFVFSSYRYLQAFFADRRASV